MKEDQYVTPDPYARAADTWIVLSGAVTSVGRRRFGLDYGRGTIEVQIQTRGRTASGYRLQKGDNVVVTGIVATHVFKPRSIDASSVYVRKLRKYFYGNPLSTPGATMPSSCSAA